MKQHPQIACDARGFVRAVTIGVALVGVWLAQFGGTLATGWAQELSPDVRVTRLKSHLDAAEQAYQQQDAAQLLENVNQAVAVLEEILQATRRSDVVEIRNQHKRLVAAHRVLKNLKAKPAPLPALKFNYVEADPAARGPDPEGISFQRVIAPLVVQKCGRCHVSRSNGGISLATAADLSTHVFPGDSRRSYLYEIVANDTMPPGNNKLTAEEKRSLQQWIDQGGRLDAGLTGFDLRTLLQPAPSAAAPAVARAAETDTVFFSKDLAPLLVESCAGCHIQANNLRGGLSLDNFARLFRGGDSGGPINPGNPAESLLVKKLLGTADGQQMPINRPKWTEEQIELLQTWIREGAKFDGLDPEQPLVELARRSVVERLSAVQLAARREELVLQRWKLALVDQPFQQGQSKHFDWIAGQQVEGTQIEQWVKIAESEYERRKAALGIDSNNAYATGRIALFFPGSNYDYSEFAKMLSRREAVGGVRGYWDQSLEGPFVVMAASLAPAEVQEHLPQLIGATMVANLAPGLPAWFCDSASLALEDSRRGRSRSAATPWAGNPPEVARRWVEGRLEPNLKEAVEQAAAAGWKKQRATLKELLQQLQRGQRLEALLPTGTGGSMAEFVATLLQAG